VSGQGADARSCKGAPGSWGEKFSPPPPPSLKAHEPAAKNVTNPASHAEDGGGAEPVAGPVPGPTLRVLPASNQGLGGQDFGVVEEQSDQEPQPNHLGGGPDDVQDDGSAAQGPAHALAVWAPAHLRDAAASARTATGESMTEYFLGAFNRTWSSLPSMFPRVAVPAGPMPMRATRRRRNVATAVQLWLYLDAEQAAVLAEAVVSLGAGSRSALVSAVLAAELNMPAH